MSNDCDQNDFKQGKEVG